MRENLFLNRVVPECQITNKVNKEGDKRKHRSKKKLLEQIDVYGCLLEGKRHQSDKLKFSNEPKQTETSRTKTWCEHNAHQNICDL